MSEAVQQAIDEINVRSDWLSAVLDPKLYAYALPTLQANGGPVATDRLSREYRDLTYRLLNSNLMAAGRITVDDIAVLLEGGPMRVNAIALALSGSYPTLPFEELKEIVNGLLRKNRNRFHLPGSNPRAAWKLKQHPTPKLKVLPFFAPSTSRKSNRTRSKELVTVEHVKQALANGPLRTKQISSRIANQVPRLSPMTIYNVVCDLLKGSPKLFRKRGFGGPHAAWILCGSKFEQDEPVSTPPHLPPRANSFFIPRVKKDMNEEAFSGWKKPAVVQPTFTPPPKATVIVKPKFIPAPITPERLAKIALAQARVDRLREQVTSPRTEMMTRAAVRQLEDDFEAATNELEALKNGERS